jgi:hypothetical protein
MQLHKLMLTTGRLGPNGRLDRGVSAFNDGGWFDVSTSDVSLRADLFGREEYVARPDTTKRIAVHARNAYWTTIQKVSEMNTGQAW